MYGVAILKGNHRIAVLRTRGRIASVEREAKRGSRGIPRNPAVREFVRCVRRSLEVGTLRVQFDTRSPISRGREYIRSDIGDVRSPARACGATSETIQPPETGGEGGSRPREINLIASFSAYARQILQTTLRCLFFHLRTSWLALLGRREEEEERIAIGGKKLNQSQAPLNDGTWCSIVKNSDAFRPRFDRVSLQFLFS